MKYKADTHAMAVTALNILDGMDHHEHFEELQPVWDEYGMGFDGFCGWIVNEATMSEAKLEAREVQDFPGVYDYDVSCQLGHDIMQHMLRTQKLPSEELISHWLDVLIDSFFEES